MLNFLDWSDVFKINFEISHALNVSIRTFFAWICGFIYDFIVILYDLFLEISTVDILRDNSLVAELYRKIGLILGMFMVFKLSFSLIKHLIEPNTLNDNKSGFVHVVKRCVIAIVLMGITPTIFKEAFVVQKLLVGVEENKAEENKSDNIFDQIVDKPQDNILSDNILYKLIIGQDPGATDVTFGRVLASEMFFSFFTDNEEPFLDEPYSEKNEDDSSATEDPYADEDYGTLVDRLSNHENMHFTDTLYYATLAVPEAGDDYNQFYIEFNGIFCLIFGIIVAWMLIMYIIQVGIRVIQLAYLQIIAPIPIFSYISNPDGSFSKWVKQCVSTYLDLFIRLMIIFFVVRLSRIIIDFFGDVTASLSDLEIWSKIVLLLALLLFAKKVPDLLKDLFPGLGAGAAGLDFGFLSPKKAWDKYIAGAPIIGKPIGWLGKKAVGLGKSTLKGIGNIPGKTLTAIDRKVHGLPKPRNKVQQYFDKLMPGRAEVIKNKNQAKLETIKNRKQAEIDKTKENKKLKLGEKYASGNLSNNFSGNYKKSYDNLNVAKANVKTAKAEYEEAERKYTEALYLGDKQQIEHWSKIKHDKKKTYDDANAQLDNAKKIHDINKKDINYKKFVEIEEAVDYYNLFNSNSKSSKKSDTIVNNGFQPTGNNSNLLSSGQDVNDVIPNTDGGNPGANTGSDDNSKSSPNDNGQDNSADDSNSGSNDSGENNTENNETNNLSDRGDYLLGLIASSNNELANYANLLKDIDDSIRGYGSLEDYSDEQVAIIDSVQHKQRTIVEIMDMLKLIIDTCNKVIANGFVNVDLDIEKIKEYVAEKERLEKEL